MVINEAQFNTLFEANFPKLCERPAMYPYKKDIKEICERIFLAAQNTMPWDKEL